MGTAKLADVKVVLSVVYAELRSRSRRKGTLEAQVVCLTAHRKFDERSTPATWTRLVAASQQLRAVAKGDQAEYGKPADAYWKRASAEANKRAEREREAAASRAATDEGGEA
jgi:hypothetical protein